MKRQDNKSNKKDCETPKTGYGDKKLTGPNRPAT